MKRRFRGAVIYNVLMGAAEGERLIAAGHADAVAFGRDYVANPDLVDRIRQGAELTPAEAATFFTPGAYGYDDYLRLAELKEGKVRKADPAFQPAADDLGRYPR
jgi:2,4-dienoyl-CoA reductase-like NADH-dependent reductase (Old Yellow Enzyme family)